MTYAEKYEVIECTFMVTNQWSEIINGHTCPKSQEPCDTKISWTIYSDRITTTLGLVDEKNIIMDDGLVKKILIVKPRPDATTIYHKINRRKDKMIISSHLLRDFDKSELAVPLKATAKECEIEYMTIDANGTVSPVTIHN